MTRPRNVPAKTIHSLAMVIWIMRQTIEHRHPTVADNLGNSSSFLLAPNLSSGTTQIGFAAAGSVITITSDAGSAWDFSIDNIGFNEALPVTIPTVVQTPPSVISIDVPLTLVAENQPPPDSMLTIAEREADGLDQQRRRGRGNGNGNGNGNSFRLVAQGFDDTLPVTPPDTTVPAPSPLPLLATALLVTILPARASRRRANADRRQHLN